MDLARPRRRHGRRRRRLNAGALLIAAVVAFLSLISAHGRLQYPTCIDPESAAGKGSVRGGGMRVGRPPSARAQSFGRQMGRRRRAIALATSPAAKELGVGVATVSRLLAVEFELIGERPVGGLSKAAVALTCRGVSYATSSRWWGARSSWAGFASAVTAHRHCGLAP